ncbi:hypothetical protein [Leptospira bandrabouensis]|uniref:Uncharacterized protein n=1 Tax=Leptospira bandrabouensis TaxID=2484903 RepID=A0A6H3NPE5_9LEPT|nr:hypothetical protein [Leptospira bandrabouensis]MCG6153110.1 hypothetical protein [Leptospira bandrabouensis]TGN06293.1 hypothetical protein EHR07_17425 [Leptospira bandrabouensis]TGN13745.1 hypothetical protein EHR08_10920 [Leptospira bandrabouensis]
MNNLSKLLTILENEDFSFYLKNQEERINLLPSFNIDEISKDLLKLYFQFLPFNSSKTRQDYYFNILIKILSKNTEFFRSYIIIFNELEEDELFILNHLKNSEIDIIDELDLDKKNNRFINRRITRTTFPIEILSHKENEKLYIDHLTSKNLITWPINKQDPIIENNSQTGVRRFSKIILTSYGKSFSEYIFN